jgi:hypothetical protein
MRHLVFTINKDTLELKPVGSQPSLAAGLALAFLADSKYCTPDNALIVGFLDVESGMFFFMFGSGLLDEETHAAVLECLRTFDAEKKQQQSRSNVKPSSSIN